MHITVLQLTETSLQISAIIWQIIFQFFYFKISGDDRDWTRNFMMDY
jgi:hypothetical protein